ncbi:MAG: uracil-DNA glycosylase [Candidatus Lightella neohaematopini]|nr:uracil-DNA glycosylase [Candidatus Lightella neohaematopini]
MINIINWNNLLEDELKKDYFIKIIKFLKHRKSSGYIIYPNSSRIFYALNTTKFNEVKIVIIGQDPYHNPKQADGLAFSVNNGIKIPPSLFNIFRELKNNFNNFIIPNHGNLYSWAKQGVLLLNSILTVEKNKPLSHSQIGWELFTDKIIKILNYYHKGLIFLLWGNFAKKKIKYIDKNKHFVLTAPHPSSYSVNLGFFGCKHFTIANNILIKHNKTPINWLLNHQ